MKETKEGYVFESTGRKFRTHGVDGFSIQFPSGIGVGYDSIIDIEDDPDEGFRYSERRELAEFNIKQWAEFAGITVEIK